MAKNYVQDGNVLTMTAPAGGVTSGGLVLIGALALVSVVDAEAGEEFAGHAAGVWNLPVAEGLEAGDAVGVDAGSIVAAATEGAVPIGKLTTDEVDGFADVRLSN